MTDIDFDELDKAVNNLMAPKKAEQADVEVSEIMSDLSPFDEPSNQTADVDPVPAAAPISLAAKRRGKFMDMMPSRGAPAKKTLLSKSPARTFDTQATTAESEESTNRPVISDIAPGRASSRGVTITPPSTMSESLDEPAKPEAEAPSEAPAESVGDVAQISADDERSLVQALASLDREDATGSVPPTEPAPAPATDSTPKPEETEEVKLPADPLIILPEDVEPKAEIPDDPEPEFIESPLATSPTADEEAPVESPLESPFLPDAKVEKRPLGGAIADEPEPETPAEESAETSSAEVPAEEASKPEPMDISHILEGKDEPAQTEEAKPEAPAAPAQAPEVPEHNHHGYESQIPMDMTESLPARPEDLTNEPTKEATEPEAKPAEKTEEALTPKAEATTASVPEADEKTFGSIYNTDSYHKPTKSTEHKRSSWMTVVWVVILLVLGGVGGALYFLFVAQQ